MNFFRLIAGIAIGSFVGALFIYSFQALGLAFFPLQMEYDMSNPDIFRILPYTHATRILWPLLVSYMAGALAGGFFAGIISKGNKLYASLGTGFVLMALGLTYLFTTYHPIWFWILSIVIHFLFAWLGGLLSIKAKKL